ncbi:MAG: hypothetical protein HRT57_02410 [Crocinitomicaceae bacterium]|nr:hypothetical protein [Crocinitomicaceae bacterium]
MIWGEGDKVLSADRGEMLKNHLGDNASLHIIENSAHMPNLTKHKEFNALLLNFLKEPVVVEIEE